MSSLLKNNLICVIGQFALSHNLTLFKIFSLKDDKRFTAVS